MKPLILISHGEMCVELKKSVEMIMGPQDDIYTVALLPNEGQAEFLAKFEQTVAGLTDFTVLADLYGGTPCNVIAKEIMAGKDYRLYAGMNMAMVIGYLNASMLGSEADLVNDAKNGVTDVNDALKALM
ncbi:phosphotransferase system sugar-specific EII component [Ligilactobacillus apodemi DSM 16634 = JCM 16172]|uniref:Phosphotransferase system sugar-specific EII component n=2 Tax=Ligilactobacillus TaxID=2767887 RepID=A0A0R1TU14_9LACO|nr:PTS fructose transporter subunit IIA [Ligilactobacillus apodemi]KRL84764.1 phosphotransferase system sugar-specific EII component [Ligilactobacillus apodemi DSM 16634 = JCM 16172]